MTDRWPGGRAARGLAAGVIVAALVAVGLVVGRNGLGSPVGAHSTATPGGASTTGTPSGSPAASAGGARPSATPGPGATPGTTLVPDPLTGLLVDPEAARYHPIAVMVDDHEGARPQSGFNAASIVFQAPAEGGIPRYMLVFQGTIPTSVGPIRSARQYYIDWAAGWNAMYVHFGGSPQALETLRVDGHGQLVWNADGFRWSPAYMWRNHDRPAPHNVYTDGTHLRELARKIDAFDGPVDDDWAFEPDDNVLRPLGNTITVIYPYESIAFKYDGGRDAYLRYINGSKKPQRDAADGQVVAPTNVIVIRMHFGPLQDSNPEKLRLEAADIGRGDAWISTGGTTIHGTWRKDSPTAPLLFFDKSGNPVTLQPGQTFIEVLPLTYSYSITQGRLPERSDRDLSGPYAPS